MITQDIFVKQAAGAYVTGTVRGQRASCTMSAECAARRLAEKLFGAALLGVVEVQEGNTFTTRWRATASEPAAGPALREVEDQALSALQTLHRVCLGMDLERQDDRPTEEEYQAAMTAAGQVLAVWTAEEIAARRKDHAHVVGALAERCKQLRGEREVLVRLLVEADKVLSTLDGESDEEAGLLAALRDAILRATMPTHQPGLTPVDAGDGNTFAVG